MTPTEHVDVAEHSTVSLLVDHPKSMTLLRTAAHRAVEMGGKWCAIFVETPDFEGDSAHEARQRMLRLLSLATQMGGDVQHVRAKTAEEGVKRVIDEEKKLPTLFVTSDIDYVNGVTKKNSSEWDKAIRAVRQRHIAVEIVPLSEPNYQQTFRERLRRIRILHLLYSLLAVSFALLLGSLLEHFLPPALFRINTQNIGLIFMIACAFAAGRFGMFPGIVASGSSFLLLNYFFTVPYHTFKFNTPDTLNLLIFLSAAFFISLFTSQTRGFAEKAARRELNTQALFTLYRLASNASSRQQALAELQQKLTRMLMMEVAFFLPSTLTQSQIEAAYPEAVELKEIDRQALALSWREMKTSGLASPFYSGSAWRFEPMIAPGGEIGVLGIRPERKTQVDAWFGRLLTAIADQTAAVLDHIELERSMEATRIREEREKLRSMLLSSVSHDLKTPLASIIGALSIYRSQGKRLSPDKQEVLIETALEESERLDSFITNILDMTHLESGKIEFKREWGDMHGVVRHVVKRLEHRLRQHKVNVQPPLKGVEVQMDMMMMEQVVQNVLDNACKYTPAGTRIDISFQAEANGRFVCEIRDGGGGIPSEKLDRVFDKYARLQKQDSQTAGTGLGLAICKATMEAQGGGISAANHPEGGAVFALHLPKWRMSDSTPYVA